MAPAGASRNLYLIKNGNFVIEGEGGSIEGYRAAVFRDRARNGLALKKYGSGKLIGPAD